MGALSFLHHHARAEADATISQVEMIKRNSYGTATARITYTVRPVDEASFETVIEAKVKMATLPQAGQQVRVSYDPSKHQKLEVLTPPGQETGTITTRTVELAYMDPRPGYQCEIESVRRSVRELAPQDGDPTLVRLKQLGELRDSGVLTEAEFETQKAKILAES